MLCQARWVERHTAFADFANMYEAILLCLKRISHGDSSSWDAKSRTDASGLLKSISSSDFIVAFCSNNYCLGYAKQLSVLLQGASQDILTAYGEIECVTAALKDDRTNVDSVFQDQFAIMETMAHVAGLSDLTVPRVCRRQTQRQNVPSESVLVYYRHAVFVPLLDHLIEELTSRFSVMAQRAVQMLCFLPSHLASLTTAKEQDLLEAYKDDLPSLDTFWQELKQRRTKWQMAKSADVPVPHSVPVPLMWPAASRLRISTGC